MIIFAEYFTEKQSLLDMLNSFESSSEAVDSDKCRTHSVFLALIIASRAM